MPAPHDLRMDVRCWRSSRTRTTSRSRPGGLLAWCAHLGADVSLLCVTRGEHGQGAKDIRRMRSRELESAARALGIRAVTLLDHEDGMLPWLPADTACGPQ